MQRDLDPDVIGFRIIQGDVGVDGAERESDVVELDEVAARVEITGVLQADAGGAEEAGGDVRQDVGVGGSKHRKPLQRIVDHRKKSSWQYAPSMPGVKPNGIELQLQMHACGDVSALTRINLVALTPWVERRR